MSGASILRSPLVHFLALGVLGFVLRDRVGEFARDMSSSSARISLDADRVEELRREFSQQMGRAPDPAELAGLIAQAVDEEILYREALARGLAEGDGGIETRLIQKMMFLEDQAADEDPARLLERARTLGLDQDDIVIRRILVQKVRLLATALESAERPKPSELARAFVAKRESLREPERRSLVHTFLSRDRRGTRAFDDAASLRRRIEQEGIEPRAATGLGDAFPLGHALESRSQSDLERSFGDAFAASTFALELGRWSLPIESAYGFHLVRIERIEAGKLPDFEAERLRLLRELEEQARDRKLEALLGKLRTRYEVAVVKSEEAAQ